MAVLSNRLLSSAKHLASAVKPAPIPRMHGTEQPHSAPPDSGKTSLSDGGVEIRPFQQHHARALFAAISESLPNLCTWLTWCRPDYCLDECVAFILKSQADWQKKEQFNFGAFDAKTQELLGSVALNQINHSHNFANLGYWVRTSKSSHGIATASVKLASQFAFRTLGFTRLEILVPVGNVPSQRTALKAGATLEGTLRNRLVLAGKLHDAFLYSLVAQDFH